MLSVGVWEGWLRLRLRLRRSKKKATTNRWPTMLGVGVIQHCGTGTRLPVQKTLVLGGGVWWMVAQGYIYGTTNCTSTVTLHNKVMKPYYFASLSSLKVTCHALYSISWSRYAYGCGLSFSMSLCPFPTKSMYYSLHLILSVLPTKVKQSLSYYRISPHIFCHQSRPSIMRRAHAFSFFLYIVRGAHPAF